MKKVTLEQFIQKYTLGGLFPSVTWEVENKIITTSAISKDRDAFASVSVSDVDLPNGSYHIVDTLQLRSLLAVLGDDLDVTVSYNASDQPLSFMLKSSDGMKVNFYLSDPVAIPDSAKPINLPPFDLVLNLTPYVIDRFLKAKSALSDIRVFTVVPSSDGEHRIVLGYDSSMNTNQVSIKVQSTGGSLSEPSSFSAEYLKEMLVANKDAKSCKLKISSKGLAQVEFDVDGFDIEYFLIKTKSTNI